MNEPLRPLFPGIMRYVLVSLLGKSFRQWRVIQYPLDAVGQSPGVIGLNQEGIDSIG